MFTFIFFPICPFLKQIFSTIKIKNQDFNIKHKITQNYEKKKLIKSSLKTYPNDE